MKTAILTIFTVILGLVSFSHALTSCYSCGITNTCGDPFDANANANNKIACTTYCSKLVSGSTVIRACTPICATGSSSSGSLSCCSDKDNCNGVDQMKVNMSSMLFLALSAVFYYLFK